MFIIKKLSLITLFILLDVVSVRLIFAKTQQANGVVYTDNNKNGKFDKGEKGLANIGVSNGRDISLTDINGNYKLPIKDGDIIFCIKPAGYATVITVDNLPSFYYIHNTKGSPKQKYAGINPTGDLPKSIDFGLIPQQESKSFRIMVFGDPQVLNDKEIDYFNRGIVDDAVSNNKNVAFGITMGDVTYDDMTVIPKYLDKLKRIGVPWYHTGGNHDLNFDAVSDEFAHETYKSYFGPLVYSFNYADVHFIVLNNVIYKGGDYEQKGEYQGGIRKSHIEFITNDLKYVPKEKLVVLVSHIPFVGREGNPTIRKNDLNQLFALLKDYKHTFSIAAHTHTQGQRFIKAPYFQHTDLPFHHQYNIGTTSGNLYSGVLDQFGLPPSTMADGTPKGYAFVDFSGNKYSIDYKVAGKPNHYKMHVHLPKVLLKHEKTRASFYVNYYLGGDLDSISFRINSGEWQPLARVLEQDPLFLNQIYQWDQSEKLLNGKRPTPAALSTHLWKGIIYGDGELGMQKLEIKVKDMFGREFSEIHTYKLVAN